MALSNVRGSWLLPKEEALVLDAKQWEWVREESQRVSFPEVHGFGIKLRHHDRGMMEAMMEAFPRALQLQMSERPVKISATSSSYNEENRGNKFVSILFTPLSPCPHQLLQTTSI